MSIAFSALQMTQNHRADIVELMLLEARAIEAAAKRLPESVAHAAIEILKNCAGKIVLLGVGKSGVIAQKIAQTMTSTGTAAVYLHPSDALHGGLGVVAANDVVIALSNSGETDEIIALLPSFARRRVAVIAIIGNMDSTLARKSAVALDASVEREACPLDLAPTASTTVALALGDALAMTLSAARGWTREDFALNHPAGRLGKRLTITVADLMHTGSEHPQVLESADWIEAVTMISRGGLGAVNVTDANQKLVGIITDGDMRRAIQDGKIIHDAKLTSRDIMTAQPVTTTPEALAFDALRLMEERASQISVLPVIDMEGRAIGLLRLHDIVRSGL